MPNSKTFRQCDESLSREYACIVCGETLPWIRLPFLGGQYERRDECLCEREATERLELVERRERTIRLFRSISGVPERFASVSFPDVKRLPAIIEALTAMERYEADWPCAESIVLSGNVGCGKTMLCSCLVNALVGNRVHAVMVNMAELFQSLRDYHSQNRRDDVDCFAPTPPDTGVSLLILDELADRAEPLSESLQSELYRTVNYRYERKLPMVVTTNKRSPVELADAIGKRSCDRLLHHARWYDIKANSYRMAEFTARACRGRTERDGTRDDV